MKRTGIILELNQKQAMVMTSDAEFITLKRKPDMYVGAPVEINQLEHTGLAFFGILGKNLRTAGLAGLTLAAIAVLTFTIFFHADAYAYVTVDINPSVELTVNQEIHVIDSRSLNEDGRLLLQGIDLKNMPLTNALITIVNQAEQEHYFKPGTGKYLLVSGVTTQESQEKSGLLDKSIGQCQTKLAERKIQMQYIQATQSQRKLALSNHLSTGRYTLMTSVKGAGRGIDLETAKTGNIGRLLDQAGLLKKSSNPQKAQKTKTNGGSGSKNLKVHPTQTPNSENQPDPSLASHPKDQKEPNPTKVSHGSQNPNSGSKETNTGSNSNSNNNSNGNSRGEPGSSASNSNSSAGNSNNSQKKR